MVHGGATPVRFDGWVVTGKKREGRSRSDSFPVLGMALMEDMVVVSGRRWRTEKVKRERRGKRWRRCQAVAGGKKGRRR
ncbi:hypothetical protein HAX54_015358, partial [Datura stramonium]|nr:hypothetical protein [Datura stramonium]